MKKLLSGKGAARASAAESGRERARRCLREHGIFFLLAAAVAWGLKEHYSRAGSEDLIWILRPTAWLVESLSGIHFEWEARSGFVNYPRRIVIAPACAGVNFLIVAFSMAAFPGFCRVAGAPRKLLWLTAALASAYVLTVGVNAVRILAAIASYDGDLQFGWLTAERVHRLQGVLIYFFFLCLFYRIISAVLSGAAALHDKSHSGVRALWWGAGLVPFCWYISMTLAAPYLNKAAARDPVRFLEHGAMIITGSITVIVTLSLVRWLRQRFGKSK